MANYMYNKQVEMLWQVDAVVAGLASFNLYSIRHAATVMVTERKSRVFSTASPEHDIGHRIRNMNVLSVENVL